VKEGSDWAFLWNDLMVGEQEIYTAGKLSHQLDKNLCLVTEAPED